MGEPNNSAPRGRKRKSKSSPKSNKRKASAPEVLVKQEPTVASPVSLPRNLDLSTTVIPQNVLPNNPQQTQTNDGPKSLTNIPNEIFVQICANLPPSDLLSLTLVCQKLKGLLCSPSSQETQAIWRTSRTRFLRFLQAPPPPGMDEKSYIVLKQLEKGCQFCHKMGFIKVYWEFRVRCCESCLDQRTMSRDKLFIEKCIPNEVFRTLPHIFRIASSFYWIKDVSRACEMFNSLLNEEEKQDWVEQEEGIANIIMQETIKHKQEEQNEQVAKFEECLNAQSSNTNCVYPPTQQQIIIRQPQLTTAPINFASLAPVTPMANMPSTPMIPSIGTMGLTNPQLQLQQFNQSQLLIPRMQNVIPFNRSQFMITSPTQQFYSQSPFISRTTQQMISQQQMVPSHMMTGIPQMLTPPQMLTSPMVSQHCFGVPQFYRF